MDLIQRISPVLVLVLALTACGGGASDPQPDTQKTEELTISSLTTILSAAAAQEMPVAQVIKSAAEMILPSQQQPLALAPESVDFSRHTLLAVTSFQSSGFCREPSIESATRDARGKLTVSYREIVRSNCYSDFARTKIARIDFPAKEIGEVVFQKLESAENALTTFPTLDSGVSPGVKTPRNVLIKDVASYNALVKDHLGEATGRMLDTTGSDFDPEFTRGSVVGVFLGEQASNDCSQVSIDSAGVTKSGELIINYRHIQLAPGMTCTPPGMVDFSSYFRTNSPMHLVNVNVAPGSIKSVTFRKSISNTLVPFAQLDAQALTSAQSGGFPNLYGITDQAAITTFWQNHGITQKMPEVDFATKTLGVLINQNSNCYFTTLERVESLGLAILNSNVMLNAALRAHRNCRPDAFEYNSFVVPIPKANLLFSTAM